MSTPTDEADAVLPWEVALFDLDGTVCDSATGIVDHLGAAMTTVGLTAPSTAELRRQVGPPWEVGLRGFGLDAVQVGEVIAVYRCTYDPVAAELSVPFEGVADLLAQLRDNGLRLAVATSKPERLAREIVAAHGLAGLFEVVGGSDVAISRLGKAAVVGSVLERLVPRPATDRIIMVGDRLYDVEGAAVHGVSTLGVAWGYAEGDELAAAGALGTARTPAELGDILLRGYADDRTLSDRH